MLYKTIFQRRAVRKYEPEPLTDNVLSDIKKHLSGLKQLDGQNAKFEVVSGCEIKNDKAPHYILAYCKNNAEAYINVGYCLQEMDLYIQSIGLGSLWLGTAKPKGEKENNDYCIMLAFGKTDVPFRKDIINFNRLEINKISNIDNNIAQAARLAPSAMNSQPWQLTFEEGKVLINYFGRGILKSILKKKFSKTDIGIITKHIELALIHNGKAIKDIKLKTSVKDFEVCVLY